MGWWWVYGYKLNETTGKILYAPDMGKYWYMDVPFAIIRRSHPWDVGVVTVMRCSVLTVYDAGDPYYLNNAKGNSLDFQILDFQSHAVLDNFGFAFSIFSAYGHGIATFFVPPRLFLRSQE
jgi:hypothetical protein